MCLGSVMVVDRLSVSSVRKGLAFSVYCGFIASLGDGWCTLVSFVEGHFEQMLQSAMLLKLHRKAVVLAIVTPIFSACVVLSEKFMIPHLSYYLVPFYALILTIVHLHGAFWYLICSALCEAGTILTGHFSRTFPNIRRDDVLDHRRMWLRLTCLTHQTGEFIGATFCVLCTVWATLITVSLYGFLSGLRDGIDWKDVGLGSYTIMCLIFLYIISNAAHQSTKKIGEMYLQQILDFKVADQEVQQQMDALVQIIVLNPPTINFAGYVQVNRGMFSSFCSMMVTYLIVLLQFRMGTDT